MISTVDSFFALNRLLLGFALFVLLHLGIAEKAAAQEASLEEAKHLYRVANYEDAGVVLNQVIDDERLNIEIRQEAYKFLARSYIAQGQKDRVRQVIKNLIATEPPTVEMDPNVEPPVVMEIYYRAMKEQRGDYRAHAKGGSQTLAVMDFTNNSIFRPDDYRGLQQGLSSVMINHLADGTDLRVIERERIGWLLNELELQQDEAMVNQSTAVETGELLGARAVIFGSFIAMKDDIQITARMVDVETGEIIVGNHVEGRIGRLFDLTNQLSRKLTASIGIEMATAEASQTQTRSIEAMMEYSEGLQLLEFGQYQEAEKRFRNALEYDEYYSQAQQKMESIQPVISALRDGHRFE